MLVFENKNCLVVGDLACTFVYFEELKHLLYILYVEVIAWFEHFVCVTFAEVTEGREGAFGGVDWKGGCTYFSLIYFINLYSCKMVHSLSG